MINAYSYFEYLILLALVLNCIGLGLYELNDKVIGVDYYENNRKIDLANKFFTIFFTIEAIIRTIYKGLIIHEKAYLRSGWCVFDLLVIIPGYIKLS